MEIADIGYLVGYLGFGILVGVNGLIVVLMYEGRKIAASQALHITPRLIALVVILCIVFWPFVFIYCACLMGRDALVALWRNEEIS